MTESEGLFEQHQNWALRVVTQFMQVQGVPQDMERAEIQQAGLIGLWKASRRFNPERGHFKTYAYTKIVSELREALRQRVEPQSCEEEPPDLAACETGDALEAREELQRVCNATRHRVGRRMQKIARLYFVDHYSERDIAGRMGLSHAWIHILLTRFVRVARELQPMRNNLENSARVVNGRRNPKRVRGAANNPREGGAPICQDIPVNDGAGGQSFQAIQQRRARGLRLP